MHSMIILASADGLEALVWLIVGALALISQGVNKWKKNQDLKDIAPTPASTPSTRPRQRPQPAPQPQRTPSGRPSPDIENQLDDFLRQLTNQPPRKPVRPATPPPPIQRPATPPILTRVPKQQTPPPRMAPPPAIARHPMDAPYDIKPVANVNYDADAGRVTKLPSIKSVTSGLQFKTKQIKSTVASNFSMTSSKKVVASRFRPDWKNRHDLSKAMIGHIILGPPKGLE